MLPRHGKIDCRACFGRRSEPVIQPHPDWRMINDPGAWGSNTPDYLVLGFSKGATQSGIYSRGRFEDVAFAGMRPRLTQALRAMGILGANETSDQKIGDPDSNIAFGSLIRCSVSRRDDKASRQKGQDVYACAGPLISKSFAEIPEIISNCASRFIRDLPPTVKAVLLLGNTDSYVRSCQAMLGRLFPNDFVRVNPMALRADGRIWVHLAHPSGLNGHFNTWLNSDSGPGFKRKLAQEAMALVRQPR